MGRNKLDIDPATKVVRGIFWQAFELRTDETELSVNYLEHFAGARIDQVRSIKADMQAAGRGIGAESGYGVLNVGRVAEIGVPFSVTLQAFKRPEPNNPSHSEVFGLPPNNNEALAQELADASFGSFFPVKTL